MKKFIFLLMLWALSAPAFCSGIQIDALVSGLRNPLTDSFLSGGLVYTYAAGTTASKSVYMDAALTTASTNPIVLDAYGRALRFANGKYKFVIKTSGGTLLWTLDNLEYSSVTTFASTTVNPFGASLAVTNFRTAALTATLAADLNANGYAIHNVATPTLPYDLATLGYVDSIAASVGSDISDTNANVASQVGIIGGQIASLTFAAPAILGSTDFTFTTYVVSVGSAGTWIPVDNISLTNSTSQTQYYEFEAKGNLGLTMATTSRLIYGAGYVGITDTDGKMYDIERMSFSDEVPAEYLATSTGYLRTTSVRWPFHLSAHISVASGTTKVVQLSYRDIDGAVSGSLMVPSGRWAKYRQVK